MRFYETILKGAYIIELDKKQDERGFFARTWCRKEFENENLASDFVQCNMAYNYKKGTVRGLHYQKYPNQEVKIVSCTSGSLYDVIVDLREESKTYGQWFGIKLTAENQKALYVPKGFAHGYQTLEDNTTIFYQVSEFYAPEVESGVNWQSPRLKIQWPICDNIIISEKDKKLEMF